MIRLILPVIIVLVFLGAMMKTCGFGDSKPTSSNESQSILEQSRSR